VLSTLAALLVCDPAFAAEFDGRSLGIAWALPFAGMVLSMALLPLLALHFWERHYGKIAAFWGLLVVAAIAASAGVETAVHAIVHTALLEYVPFILLLLALFAVAGGILVRGNIHGAPATNAGLLALGAVLASLIGTTGASMVLIRPILRANDDRRHNVHVVVFFIFLVSNIGGSLTPLGDPPLFLGFLRGVDFFWTTQHLLLPTLATCGALLAVFFVIDTWLYTKEGRVRPDPTPDQPVHVVGFVNFALIGIIIAAILMSAMVTLGQVSILGTEVKIENLLRDLIMVAVTFISLAVTPKGIRAENGFTWGPMAEVGKLFAAIFITIIPVLMMLRAGTDGVFGSLVALVSNPDGTHIPAAYFWLSGSLSSFLDNAPTYLVFFELAGGDPQRLMTVDAPTLLAISAGAVFMGAITYVGNAPNLMVCSIARTAGVKMPTFFGYMVWSLVVLLPVFGLLTLLFFV
jgi:Na+/H+ antiporter NhaD/arsenite permease-like protein